MKKNTIKNKSGKKLKLSISPLRRSKGYVAFLDLLGFKNLLDDPLFVFKMATISKRLEARAEFDKVRYPSLRYLAISDTIIVTATEGDGYALVRKIAQVQSTLLKLGVAVRGAIAFGTLITHEGHLGRNILGKTYLSAYFGEQQLAIYPRVVVLDNAYSEIKTDIQTSTERPLKTYLLRDADGVRFVNQFSSEAIGLTARLERNRTKTKENCQTYQNKIDEGLATTDPKAKMKWRWLQDQFDAQLPINEWADDN